MKQVIFDDTEGKTEILSVLRDFNDDKNKKSLDKKYKYVNKLTSYQKGDLEAAKADIEYFINDARTIAALIAALGAFFLKYLPLLLPKNSNFSVLEAVVALFIFVFAAFFLWESSSKDKWIHIIKIAIARKSQIDCKDSSSMAIESELQSNLPPTTVFDYIKSTGAKTIQVSHQNNSPRIPGLHSGEIWMSEDFNEPLPDEFWLGEDE